MHQYVIERTSEMRREWWTGSDWTEDENRAKWYDSEPHAQKRLATKTPVPSITRRGLSSTDRKSPTCPLARFGSPQKRTGEGQTQSSGQARQGQLNGRGESPGQAAANTAG